MCHIRHTLALLKFPTFKNISRYMYHAFILHQSTQRNLMSMPLVQSRNVEMNSFEIASTENCITHIHVHTDSIGMCIEFMHGMSRFCHRHWECHTVFNSKQTAWLQSASASIIKDIWFQKPVTIAHWLRIKWVEKQIEMTHWIILGFRRSIITLYYLIALYFIDSIFRQNYFEMDFKQKYNGSQIWLLVENYMFFFVWWLIVWLNAILIVDSVHCHLVTFKNCSKLSEDFWFSDIFCSQRTFQIN